MKLVITGKPKSGKTTLAHILEREFPNKVVLAPDPHELMKTVHFPEVKSLTGRKCYLTAIYHLQCQLENILAEKAEGKLLICDHGTLDWLSMWPDSKESFFREMNSSLSQELARYQWVLQINGSHFQHEAWGHHPHLLSIPVHTGFSDRATLISTVVRDILENRPYEVIQGHLIKSVGSKDPIIEHLDIYP